MRFTSAITACLSVSFLVPSVFADEVKKTESAAVQEAKEIGTREVKLKDLTLKLPMTWEEQKSASSMRLGTYSIPAVKGDEEPAELAVFNFGGGGGTVSDNLDRWIKQFSGDGKTVKVTKGKAGENEYFIADIAGTYNKPVGPLVLQKTEPAENYRMLGAIVVLEGKGVYFLKLAGPDATVKAQAKMFRESFMGDVAKETDYEI